MREEEEEEVVRADACLSSVPRSLVIGQSTKCINEKGVWSEGHTGHTLNRQAGDGWEDKSNGGKREEGDPEQLNSRTHALTHSTISTTLLDSHLSMALSMAHHCVFFLLSSSFFLLSYPSFLSFFFCSSR